MAGLGDRVDDTTVLRFYQLDSMQPTNWVDQVYSSKRGSKRESVARPDTRNKGRKASQPDLIDDDLDLADDSDPLGLKPSIFKGIDAVSKASQGPQSLSDLRERSSLITSNKTFSPRHFLLTVHKDTPYQDLVSGVKNLELSLHQRSEAMQNLVYNNFDSFVAAKKTIDHVFEEMKAQKLNEKDDYGTKKLSSVLTACSATATEVYGPVVERRVKAEKIRATLSVLERYKFFFNLPSNLLNQIRQTKYEAAIRDYKKGKYLYNSLQKENPAPQTDDDENSTISQEEWTDLHRKVFKQVWDEVEKITVEFQAVLKKQLEEPWRSIDDQEKTINYILELDPKSDPAWHYLDCQYRWIIGLLNDTYTEEVKRIDALKNQTSLKKSDKDRSLRLKTAIKHISSRELDVAIGLKENGIQIWRSTLGLVKSLSDILLRCLPDFWKLSKSFIEGKHQRGAQQASSEQSKRRRQGVDLVKVEQCHTMAKDIVNLYASIIAKHFTLDDLVDLSAESTRPLPFFLPENTDSVTTGYFLTKIITELANCVNDINAINMAGEAFAGLTRMMEDVKVQFLEIICETWARDAKTFYLLENWVLDSENSQVTLFLKSFYAYHKYCARSAYKVASLSAVSENSDDENLIKPEHLTKIKGSFLDSIYSFLDGLVHLAFSDYSPLESDTEDVILGRGRVDISSQDARVLLTVSNLAQLKRGTIPQLVSLFESAYKINMADELKTLTDVVDQLDGILFDDFVKRTSAALSQIVKRGILYGGVDWFSISKPTEVHPFVYEALLKLVMVHSQVTDIAKSLLYRALSSSLDSMAQDCLECFRQIDKFGMGGMLQATLEIEFMHQTLSQYVTPTAAETLQQIYATIEKAYDSSQQSQSNLQSELASVKALLVESRKSTVIQFMCFKQPKQPPKKSSARDGTAI